MGASRRRGNRDARGLRAWPCHPAARHKSPRAAWTRLPGPRSAVPWPGGASNGGDEIREVAEEYANQAAQRCASAVQAGVGFAALFIGRDVVEQAIPRVGEFFAGRLDNAPSLGLTAGWLSDVAAQFLVQPAVRVLDAVLNRVQLPLGEKLMPPADDNIRALPAVEIVAELRRVNLLVCLGVEAIPAQDVVARAADEDVCQQVRQLPLSVLNQLEVLLQVRRVNR